MKVLSEPLFWGSLLNGCHDRHLGDRAAKSFSASPLRSSSIGSLWGRLSCGRCQSCRIFFRRSSCLITQWILDPNYGLLKSVFASFGYGMFDWGGNSTSAKATIVLVSVWIWTPFVVTCVLAGLQSIPAQLYETARVDGAGVMKQFWHVTLPGLRSVLIVVILLRGIWMFNKFDVIWLQRRADRSTKPRRFPRWPTEKRFSSSTWGAALSPPSRS